MPIKSINYRLLSGRYISVSIWSCISYNIKKNKALDIFISMKKVSKMYSNPSKQLEANDEKLKTDDIPRRRMNKRLLTDKFRKVLKILSRKEY